MHIPPQDLVQALRALQTELAVLEGLGGLDERQQRAAQRIRVGLAGIVHTVEALAPVASASQ